MLCNWEQNGKTVLSTALYAAPLGLLRSMDTVMGEPGVVVSCEVVLVVEEKEEEVVVVVMVVVVMSSECIRRWREEGPWKEKVTGDGRDNCLMSSSLACSHSK
jgi:hypothetical protein